MKEIVQRRRAPLYVVSAPPSSNDLFDFTPISLDRSFEGWLRAVEAAEEKSKLEEKSKVVADSLTIGAVVGDLPSAKHALQLCKPILGKPETRPPHKELPRTGSLLSTQDYITVMLSTIRESFRHICWPPQVVAKFLAADVIKRVERDGEKTNKAPILEDVEMPS